MRSSLRFWGRYTGETLLTGLIVAGLGLMAALIGGAGPATLLAWFPWFFALGCAMGVLLTAFSAQLLYIPLVLSMGSTRREARLGFTLFRLAAAALTALVSGLAALLLPGEGRGEVLSSIPLLVLLLLQFGSVGSLFSLVRARWKTAGVILLALLGALCGGVGGYVGATAADGGFGELVAGFTGALSALHPYLVPGLLVWALTALLDWVCTGLHWRSAPVKL